MKKTNPNNELIKQISSACKSVNEIRRMSNGILPKDLWLKVIELNGYYVGIELILVNPEGKLILKVRRDPISIGGELDWEGKLHLPGTSFPPNSPAEKILSNLIKKEIVEADNDHLIPGLVEKASFWGFIRYDMPERNTQAYSLIMKIIVEDEKEYMQNDLKEVDEENLNDVIDMHKTVIRKYFENPNGGVFLDCGF